MKGFSGSLLYSNLLKAISGCISRMYQKGNMIDVCDASLLESRSNMGVSKNRGGPPKWMVYKGKALSELMIWGYPYFWKHPYIPHQPYLLIYTIPANLKASKCEKMLLKMPKSSIETF